MDSLEEKYLEGKKKSSEEFNAKAYYFIIAIVSILMLVFLPMLGTQVGLEFKLPTTTVGWIVYVVIKLIVAAGNVLIFHGFVQQGRLNIKNDANYIKAKEMLQNKKDKKTIPQSPKEFLGKLYLKKGTSIFASSLLSAVALTQALLAFDFLSFLTYLFTIIMGIIFGVMTMFQVEEYYTTTYLEYANYIIGGHENGSNNRQ